MHPVRQSFYSCGFSSNPLYPSDLFFHNHIIVRQTPTVGPEEAVDSRVPPQTHRVSPAALTKELLTKEFFFFLLFFNIPLRSKTVLASQTNNGTLRILEIISKHRLSVLCNLTVVLKSSSSGKLVSSYISAVGKWITRHDLLSTGPLRHRADFTVL